MINRNDFKDEISSVLKNSEISLNDFGEAEELIVPCDVFGAFCAQVKLF